MNASSQLGGNYQLPNRLAKAEKPNKEGKREERRDPKTLFFSFFLALFPSVMSASLSLIQAPARALSLRFLKSAANRRYAYALPKTHCVLSSSSSYSSPGFVRSSSRPFGSSTAAMAKADPAAAASVVDADDASMDAVQKRLMFEDECILVDEHDNVVGHDSKYNCHLMEKIEKENLLHRAFSVFLFNSKYELLLQQRSPTKVTFPLVWTNTCCSHPLYRESELIEENYLGVRNAAQRKLFDELGIPAEELPVDEFIPLGRILYKAPSDGKWGEHELDYLLFIVHDVNVRPNPDEVAEFKFANREQVKELLQKADAGEVKLSPWFRLVVDNFLMKWWDHVEKGTLLEAANMETIHKL